MDRWLFLAAIAALLGYQPAEAKERDPRFTGDPQIDWEFDPNLPRELRGFNMTGYPFLSRPPNKMKFSCRDRIDGFYSNMEYKCQVYHHCLYGIRQDFLCGNYTAFDMSTFICQFVNVVDCEGSDKFVYRNEPLYKFTTTVEPKRKRPFQRRPPAQDYEYDYDYDYPDYDYLAYDEPEPTTTTTTTTTTTRRPVRRRPGVRRRRPGVGGRRRPQQQVRRRPQPPVYDYYDYQDTGRPAEAAVEQRKPTAAPAAAADPLYADYDYDYVDEPVPTQAPVRQQQRRRRPGARPGGRPGGQVGGRRRPAPVRAQAALEESTAPVEPALAEPVAAPVATRRRTPPAAVPEEEPIENEVLDSVPQRGRPGRPFRRRPVEGSRRPVEGSRRPIEGVRRGSLVGRRPVQTAPRQPAAEAPEPLPPPPPPAPALEQEPAPAAPARGRRPGPGPGPGPGGRRPGLRNRPRQRQRPRPQPDYDYYDFDSVKSVSDPVSEAPAPAPAEEPPLYEDVVPVRKVVRRRGGGGGGGGGRGVGGAGGVGGGGRGRRGGRGGRVGGQRRPAAAASAAEAP